MKYKPKYHTITGESMWASVLEPTNKWSAPGTPADQIEKEYRITINLDRKTAAEVEDILAKSGAKNRIKYDANGNASIKFSRKYQQKKMDGTVFQVTPPIVTDADGSPWDKTKAIGNGSKVTVMIQEHSFQSKFGKMTRLNLMTVQVLEHVEYIKNGTPIKKEEEDDLNF